MTTSSCEFLFMSGTLGLRAGAGTGAGAARLGGGAAVPEAGKMTM